MRMANRLRCRIKLGSKFVRLKEQLITREINRTISRQWFRVREFFFKGRGFKPENKSILCIFKRIEYKLNLTKKAEQENTVSGN